MTKKPREWTESELSEILAKAEGLFGTLVGLTDTPGEAAEILAMMHLLLYMNHGDGQMSVDTMLEQYTENFKANFEAQVEAHRKVAN